MAPVHIDICCDIKLSSSHFKFNDMTLFHIFIFFFSPQILPIIIVYYIFFYCYDRFQYTVILNSHFMFVVIFFKEFK